MVLRGLTLGVCLWLVAAPPLAALNKNEVRELENLLARLGFDPGPVDGVLDAQTRTAIKGYQDFAALPVTGRASWSLLDELRGVTESLDDVRIPESVPQAVLEPETAKAQEKVTEPAFAAPKPPGPKPAAPKKAPVETAPVKTAAVQTAPVKTAAVQTEATKAPAAETAPASTGPATFEIALQLAAFRSEVGARRGWGQIQQQLPDLLGGMSPRFPAVDLGEEGIYYRVLTGPFPNRATAADICAMMTAEGQECRVIQSAPQQVAEATPTQAAAEPASPTPAAAPAEPARAESPPKPAIGEPLAPPPAKPVVAQDKQAAAPLQLAEAEISAPSPEPETAPAKKAGLVPPAAPAPTEEPPEPAPEVEQSAGDEVTEPVPEEATEEVTTAPEDTAEPAASEELAEPTPSEAPQLATAETLAPAPDEAAGEPSAALTEEGLPQFAEAGVFSPFPVEDAPPAAQAPPSAAAEGSAAVPPLSPSQPALSETPQLASLPKPRAADLQSADIAFDLNDCQLAIRLYTQALEQVGLSSRGQAEAYNNRGRCYHDGRYFEEAIADFNTAIDRQPNYAAAFFNRGRAHQAVGETALAQSDMQKAYELGFKRLGLSPTTP
jgi:peptidoglycan hydrolase-like protein with peptidoglycan-binding domain